MIATCQLCNQTIQSTHVPFPQNLNDPATVILEYDSLARAMWLHITERHPFQMDEMTRVMNHAAKMYAMNWAEIDSRLESTRREWRAQLIMLMATMTRIEAHDPGAAAGAAPAAGGLSSGEASNEKNESRKDSN